MPYIMIFLALLCAGLALGSLLFPARLVPGAKPKRTRFRGFFFWAFAAFVAVMWGGMLASTDRSLTAWMWQLGLTLLLWWWFRVLRRPPAERERQTKTMGLRVIEVERKNANESPNEFIPSKKKTKLIVPSHSEDDVLYEIDIENLTCTCPDWLKRRSHTSQDSPSRLCKHLVEYFSRKPVVLPPKLKPYKELISLQGKRLRGMVAEEDDVHVIYDKVDEIPFMADYREGTDWINVVIRGQRYGYNWLEERWSYGKEPEYAERIVSKIERLSLF